MNFNLEKLKKLPKDIEISILPHDNPDVDAILSSVLLSKLLEFLGYKNSIIILDKKISQDTLHICSLAGVRVKDYIADELREISKVFLVDHYLTNHSDNVLGCIDHHPTKSPPDYYIYEFRTSCSTANIIYSFMLELGMKTTKEIVMLLGYAMLVDTVGLTSNKTVKEEADELLCLLKQYNLDYYTMRKESLCYTNIYNMKMYDIINNGAKIYNYSKGKVKSSYLQLEKKLDESILYNILKEIKYELENSDNCSLWLYIVYNIQDNKTVCYYIKANVEVYQKCYVGILLRGNDIMPDIEKMYSNQ